MAGPIDLAALEARLAPLSHGTEALDILREALRVIGKWGAQQEFLNEHLLRAPILHVEAAKQISPAPETFHTLQGDLIRTDAAFVLGIRRVEGPTYVMATSSCDVIPGRRKAALLLPVYPRKNGDLPQDKLHGEMANLVSFKSNQYFYLPPCRMMILMYSTMWRTWTHSAIAPMKTFRLPNDALR